ncbi:MAG TPA: PP2C family protein-serine/threonine phosphatase [Bryobacteraceae bacterium]|nr:PP2C family protein-serine/threonine phosphatase [Bryobacteraceae bacterium]
MASLNPVFRLDESQLAREVQSRIFPSLRPSVPGLDYYSDWRPAATAGGDYLDYFEMDEGSFGIAIGNVSAQGIEAALLTTSLHSIVRALRFSRTRSLAELVGNIDGLFRDICSDNCYATLFLGQFDPISGRLHYVNAGHEPPFVLRPTGRQYRSFRLEARGPWLGMLRKPTYREGVVSLIPGDLIVAYTDGLCEAVNPQGEEFGWTRFLSSLTGPRRRARDIVREVFLAADEFVAGAPQTDDMTLWLGRVEETHAMPMLRLAEHSEEPVAA